MGKTNNDLLQFLSAIGVNNECAMVFFDNDAVRDSTAAAANPSSNETYNNASGLIPKFIKGSSFQDLLNGMLKKKLNKVKLSWYFIANDRVNISMITYLTHMIKQIGNFPLSTYLKSVNFGSIHTQRGTLTSYISSGFKDSGRPSIGKPLNERDQDRLDYNNMLKYCLFEMMIIIL
jgi:hypothetical protein